MADNIANRMIREDGQVRFSLAPPFYTRSNLLAAARLSSSG